QELEKRLLPVPMPKCALCAEYTPGKMAAVYWGWRYPSGDRRSYKQLYDANCYRLIHQLAMKSEEGLYECPICLKNEPLRDTVTFFGTVFLPGGKRIDFVADVCEPCHLAFEGKIMQNATRLPDRTGAGAGGPQPQPHDDPWSGYR